MRGKQWMFFSQQGFQHCLPQRSFLGPVMFIFVNGLEEAGCLLIQFSDSTKLRGHPNWYAWGQLSCEERLRVQYLFTWEKGWLWGCPTAAPQCPWQGYQEDIATTVHGRRAKANRQTEDHLLVIRKDTFSLLGQWDSETGCPKWLCSLQPWRLSGSSCISLGL